MAGAKQDSRSLADPAAQRQPLVGAIDVSITDPQARQLSIEFKTPVVSDRHGELRPESKGGNPFIDASMGRHCFGTTLTRTRTGSSQCRIKHQMVHSPDVLQHHRTNSKQGTLAMEGRDRGFQRTVKSGTRAKGGPTKIDRRTEGRRAITGETDLGHLVGSDSHVRFDPIDPEGLLAIESQNTIEIHHGSGVGQIGCLDRSTWGGLPVLSPQADQPRSTRSAPGEDEQCQETEERPQNCLRLDHRH